MERDEDSDTPVEIGDNREKHVTVITNEGEHRDHGNVYLRHSETAFVVSSDSAFPDEETERYAKDTIRRVEVTQHHSACFITTATAGDGPTLNTLRAFRDDALIRTPPGRALVHLYEIVSPPIAATLARHPHARTTRFVRWLIERCASLAHHRSASHSSIVQSVLSVVLTTLYIIGLCSAALGHGWIRLSESSGSVTD